MKTFAKAAFCTAVMLAAISSTSGAETQTSQCDDDVPGMEGGRGKGNSPSPEQGGVAMPRTMTVLKRIMYDEPTLLDLEEDFVIESEETIYSTNLHFHVHNGVTLTFRAPAIKIAREEGSSLPLFELSGTVKFDAVGSAPPLLDGSLVDEAGLLEVWDDGAVFMSGPHDVVRYHDNEITVSRTQDTGGLGGVHDGDAQPEQRGSTNEPPTPAAGDLNPSVWSPKHVFAAGDILTDEPLVASTGTSAVWATKRGDIVFAKETAKASDVSGQETSGGLHTSVLVAADIGKLKRVVRARQVLLKELQDGDSPTHESGRRSAWGWVPFRSRHQKDVDRAREHLGKVEMSLSDKGCVEVSLDGTCVLAKSGPYKREWMNRFPWRRSKSKDYQLHVKDDGMEVRLGERMVWGVTTDEMMG